MPDADLLALARNARECAEEALSRAETFLDPESRQKKREIAGRYDRLAERLEQVAALDALAANTRLDGATVDIKLMGAMTFSVADALASIHIPFLFMTGYGRAIPFRHANVRRLEKPVTPTVVCRELEGLMFGASVK